MQETTIVRENLMTRPGYAPYCMQCPSLTRAVWDGEQFKCGCGWRSSFPADFITRYKAQWSDLWKTTAKR